MVGVVRERPGDDWEDRRGHSGFGEALPHPTLAFWPLPGTVSAGSLSHLLVFPLGPNKTYYFSLGTANTAYSFPTPCFFIIFFKDSMLDGKVPVLPG